jgi:DnaJ-class molecular chaperone
MSATKFLERKGDNIYITVPITVSEAALGTRSSADGRGQGTAKIPSGTESGQKFRLRGRFSELEK